MRVPAVAFSLALGIAAHSAAAQGNTGWTFAMRFTIDSGAGGTPVVMSMRQQVAGSRLRMETSALGMPEEASGMYMIFSNADTSMTTVMPGQRAAMIMPMNGMPGMPNFRAQRMSVHATNSDLTDLGPGEAILGHATHRYRIASSGAMELTIMGQTCTQKFDHVSELWIAPDVDMDAARQAILNSMSSIGPMELEMQMYGSARSQLPKGTALRTVATTKSYDVAGNARPVTTTMEYTELSHGAIPDSAFAIPAGFQTTNMRELMKAVPAGMLDSVMKATREKGSNTVCDAFGRK